MKLTDIAGPGLSSILEVMNTVLPFRKLHSDAEKDMYVFEFNDTTYVVDFEVMQPFAPLAVKSVTFYEAIQGEYNFNISNKHTGKNTGPLFRTVSEIITSTASDWDVISFVGEQSRVGLYSALGKKFSGTLHTKAFITPAGALWVISKDPLEPSQTVEIAKYATDYIQQKVHQ